MILGIDFGSSTTDIVLMNKKNSIVAKSTDEKDILTMMKSVKVTKVTGSGSLRFKDNGKIKVIDEIRAIGIGGTYVANKKNALVVSIGSGTCMVSVKDKKYKHIGGTPMGGRTLTGLGQILLQSRDIDKIESLAEKGNLEKIDLTLKEIYPKGVGMLPPTATAAHFGHIKNPNKHDAALAILNMLAQTIATLSVFAAKSEGQRNIILTGRLTKIKAFRDIIKRRINTLSNIPVTIPKNAECATAIGAVLA